MSPDEVVRAFFDTLANEGREEAASRYMAPDVTLDVEGEPPTVGPEGWLGRQGIFEDSFPDMNETTVVLTATHRGREIELQAMSFPLSVS